MERPHIVSPQRPYGRPFTLTEVGRRGPAGGGAACHHARRGARQEHGQRSHREALARVTQGGLALPAPSVRTLMPVFVAAGEAAPQGECQGLTGLRYPGQERSFFPWHATQEEGRPPRAGVPTPTQDAQVVSRERSRSLGRPHLGAPQRAHGWGLNGLHPKVAPEGVMRFMDHERISYDSCPLCGSGHKLAERARRFRACRRAGYRGFDAAVNGSPIGSSERECSSDPFRLSVRDVSVRGVPRTGMARRLRLAGAVFPKHGIERRWRSVGSRRASQEPC